MVKIAVESFTESLDEIKSIFPSHWEELALNKDKVKLNPDYEAYRKMEERGELLFVTMREDGKPIGYFIGFVARELHYQDCLACSMDIFYVVKEYRNKLHGIKLFRFVENELRKRKVNRWHVGTKTHASAESLFRFFGFEKTEEYFSKWLED